MKAWLRNLWAITTRKSHRYIDIDWTTAKKLVDNGMVEMIDGGFALTELGKCFVDQCFERGA